MIIVSRLNGHEFALNSARIEKVEETPDTVITLINGTKFIVEESIHTVIERIRAYHASVIVAAEELTGRAISRAHLQLVLAPSEES